MKIREARRRQEPISASTQAAEGVDTVTHPYPVPRTPQRHPSAASTLNGGIQPHPSLASFQDPRTYLPRSQNATRRDLAMEDSSRPLHRFRCRERLGCAYFG